LCVKEPERFQAGLKRTNNSQSRETSLRQSGNAFGVAFIGTRERVPFRILLACVEAWPFQNFMGRREGVAPSEFHGQA
jgi:hypothetical protein